jgi:K+ transporter
VPLQVLLGTCMVIGDGVLTPAISGVTSFMIQGEPRLKHDRAF